MAGKTLKASIVIGGSMSGAFRSALSSTKTGLKDIGSAIVDVERKQRLLGRSIETFGRMGKNVDGLRRQYAGLVIQADRLRSAQSRLASVQSRIDANNARRVELGSKFRGAVGTFGVVAATAVFPINQAVKFETAMLGVAKQVNGARDASGNLTAVYFDMARQIQKLGHELPMATNDIADMVTAGARMGIPREQLIGFARDAAMMSTAFEAPAGELADSMGKIAGIFKIPVTAMGALGDSINYLDDNAKSKGGDIIRVLQGDLAGASVTMGLSAKNAAALASTFLTLGESAERADTAAAGMLRQLQVAKMNPKRFQIGVKMLGMTADQLQKGMINDPQAMILDVLGRIKKLPVEKQMEAVTRLFGKDWGGAIAKLANGVDEYRRQLDLANGAAAKGSMSREFQSRMKTTAAQWQITKNRASEVAVALGSALLPAVNDLMKSVGPVVERFAEWSKENPGLVKGIIGGALALAGLRVATLGVGFAFTTIKTPILAVWGAVARYRAASAAGTLGIVGRAVQVLGKGFMWLGRTILLNPVFLIGAAVAGLAYEIYKHWDGVKAFFGRLWNDIGTMFGGQLKFLKGLFTGDFGMMVDGVKQMFTGFKTFVTDIFKGITDGLVTIVDDALEAMGLLDKKKREMEVGKEQAAKETEKRHGVILAAAEGAFNPGAFAVDMFKAIRAPAPVPIKWNTGAANDAQPSSPTLTPARGRRPPATPAPAMRSGNAGTVVHQQYTFNVTQLPGESAEAFARRVEQLTRERQAVAHRSRLGGG
jgi:TP901 family phage tail tape measure protein